MVIVKIRHFIALCVWGLEIEVLLAVRMAYTRMNTYQVFNCHLNEEQSDSVSFQPVEVQTVEPQ